VNELTVDECRAERSEALTNVLSRWVETVSWNEGPLGPSGMKVDVQPNGVEHLVNEVERSET
jgi:hypothetical protein